MLQHLKAVWAFRYFWLSLVKMDLRTRYRRSILGIGWSVLHPIAMSAVFCLVFSTLMQVKQSQIAGYPEAWRAYAAYLLTGLAVWDFLRVSAGNGCQALIGNEAYIRQCPLPYGIYPLRTVLGTGVHFLISLVVVLVLVSLLKESFEPVQLLWAVLPVVAMLFLFCWAVATLAAFATVYFHDTTHLIDVGLQLAFFLTPIMYDRSVLRDQGIDWLADLNPANLFLELMRLPIVQGVVPDTQLYVQAAVLTAACVGLAFGTIGWLQKKVIFHL